MKDGISGLGIENSTGLFWHGSAVKVLLLPTLTFSKVQCLWQPGKVDVTVMVLQSRQPGHGSMEATRVSKDTSTHSLQVLIYCKISWDLASDK